MATKNQTIREGMEVERVNGEPIYDMAATATVDRIEGTYAVVLGNMRIPLEKLRPVEVEHG